MADHIGFWGPIGQAISFLLVTPQFLGPERIEKIEKNLEALLAKFSALAIERIFLIVSAAAIFLAACVALYQALEDTITYDSWLRVLPILVPTIVLLNLLGRWPDVVSKRMQRVLDSVREQLASGTPLASLVFAIGAGLFFAMTLLEASVGWPY